MEIDKEITRFRQRQRLLKKAVSLLKRYYDGELTEKSVRKQLKSARFLEEVDSPLPCAENIPALQIEERSLTRPIKECKDSLCALLNRFSGIRTFRKEFVNSKNIISIFDSYLTRIFDIQRNELTTDIVVVKTCYFKILNDIIENGFFLNGDRYVIYTASAGQIRTKRSVFIREEKLSACSNRLMCGLTVDRINELDGINTNKYLAYLALSNSATDEWADFNIDRCIVVNDMETNVYGTVDYIDHKTYSITRKAMDVPITHTDGAGMVRPDIFNKNFMIRLPWVKGLLASFPFDKFIREANRADPSVNHGIVKDIYGMEHDILNEDIQIIFTKSQFKAYKYYKSWGQYCEFYHKYNCSAGICNVEEDSFGRAKINYQMLQTLTDMDDDELIALAAKTTNKLKNMSFDRGTMLDVFGATVDNRRRNPFQDALMTYPELLQDEYCRDVLRLIIAKLKKEAWAGRLDVDGHYTFLIPDMYAFCQFLFLGDTSPSGLLEDGEVYCRLFASGAELDCLRSPHLYMEHAIRKNMSGVTSEAKRWFQTDGIYTSCHDNISKILMFDNDGDKALVISDQTLINAAKRNLARISAVPLYYEMAKAEASLITPSALYNGMISAYTGGNIGAISNAISKIWNSKSPDIEAVKFLCMENNFVIDYAKTLYKPTREDEVDVKVRAATTGKLPHFFIYAKDKTESQVEPINQSCVNRLSKIVPDVRLNFSKQQLGKFDWRMLVSSDKIPNNEITQNIIDTYKRKTAHLNFRYDDESDGTNRFWICKQIRETVLSLHPDPVFVVDVLVKYLFHKTKSRRKQVFWECFGKEVLANLKKNIDKNSKMCILCGKRYYQEGHHQTMCSDCSQKRRRPANIQPGGQSNGF